MLTSLLVWKFGKFQCSIFVAHSVPYVPKGIRACTHDVKNYCAPAYITCLNAARLTAVLPTSAFSLAVVISTSILHLVKQRENHNCEHDIKSRQTHKARHVVCTLFKCMHTWTSHNYRGGVLMSTWWRGKPSGASDLSNHQGRHRPEVRPLGATGSQLCSVGCLGENKQWQPLIHKFTAQANWPVRHAYPTPHGIHFSVSFSPQSSPITCTHLLFLRSLLQIVTPLETCLWLSQV